MAGLISPRPLNGDDDREGFDCGRDSLNQWFRRNAWRNQQSGASRTSVVCAAETREIAGYVSLSSAQIERAYLPKPAQRNQPDPLPAILLGQLAVDRRYQGRGYARSLMWFALTTAVRFSKDIGCFGVVTHPLDDELRAFYRRFGFEDLPFDPRRAMIVRVIDLERNGF
ncbi:MAG: GNAT family N-acetyltransferase [Acidocella sp.]|nr:GNAT family N-acetyltransferase [Acidocella sp.]